ncbi:MAG: aminotransferase class IV [Mariprofundaceae bacterium]
MTKTELNIHYSDKLDRGLAYGEACFETFRVIDGKVFDWQQHLSRLITGLESFGISLSEHHLELIQKQLLARTAEVADDALVRLTITGGSANWGLVRNRDQKPEVYIQCMPYVSQRHEAELSTVEWPYSLQAKIAKFSSDYALTLRAMQQWKHDGLPESKIPLICKNGQLLSTLTANLLIYRKGRWHTPDESCGGILPGVVRNALITNSLIEVSDCPITWLDDCDAIALTNSGFFIQPAGMVNGRALNTKQQLFETLYQAFKGKPGVPA